MPAPDLAPQTVNVLRAAGWYPGRAVDVSGYVECWRAGEISPNGPATEFCTEFGGLTIRHPPELTIAGEVHSNYTSVDGCAATRGIRRVPLREYSRLAGEQLCPVGENRSHMTLLIGPSGAVLGGVDNYLVQFGADRNAALETICSGARPDLVGEWHLAHG